MTPQLEEDGNEEEGLLGAEKPSADGGELSRLADLFSWCKRAAGGGGAEHMAACLELQKGKILV